MTSLSRKRMLVDSINNQIVEFRLQGGVLQKLSQLLLEYVDRALGFAVLDLVPPDEFADTDHYSLIAIGSQALLKEIQSTSSTVDITNGLLDFRISLCDALLTPDVSRLTEFRRSIEDLMIAIEGWKDD